MPRLAASLFLTAVTALGGLAWWCLDTPVGHVRVDGALAPAERAQVRQVVAASVDGGLLSLELARVRDAIGSLTWPQRVTVRRAWPGTLLISVDKATVVAAWGDAHLTSDGRVVRLPAATPDLPVFDCALSDPVTAMALYHRLTGATGAAGLDIARLAENALGEWTITFRGGVSLNLGAERTGERLGHFLTVYEHRLADRFDEVHHVDARYGNGVAVSWRGVGDLQGIDTVAAAAAVRSVGTQRGNDGI